MKRILVALDASARAPAVLAAATRLAEHCDARLVLFRAIGIPLDVSREGDPDHLEDILRSRAHAQLDQLASTVHPDMVERCSVELGTPWDAIVRAGRELDADLIVLGSHGFSGLDRVLGTTAAKVVNHADRNVLVARTAL